MSPRHPRILLATRSPHKLEEIRDLLGAVPVEFVSLTDLGLMPTAAEDSLEAFDTFTENARAKAEHFHRLSRLPTVADDSGLCVDALDGQPGVRTKRFAPPELATRWGRDEANNRYLLDCLADVPESRRGAEYRCALAAITAPPRPSGKEGGGPGIQLEVFVVEGRVRGRIAREGRGRGGFGYDPLFIFPPGGGTFAELPPEVKREHSHRAQAIRKLRPWVESLTRSH